MVMEENFNANLHGDDTATKDTCKNTPMVKPKQVTIAEIAPNLALSFTEEQYRRLQKGFVPTAMEDKWFIYCENDCLHFHRSWTGLELYRAPIITEANKNGTIQYAIKAFDIETDEGTQKDGNDQFDLDILAQLILWGLLGIDIRKSFIDVYGEGPKGALLIWSLFGRMFFPE
jgi:hypothetical protein